MKRHLLICLILLCTLVGTQAQLLYRISGNGLNRPSYIVGTYHLADGSFINKIPGATAALGEVQQVCGETNMIDMLNPDTVAFIDRLGRLPQGMTIKTILGEEQFKKLDQCFATLAGFPLSSPLIYGQVKNCSPMVLLSNLQVLACLAKEGRTINPETAIDVEFQQRAIRAGKTVMGFETVEYQANVLFGLPLEQQTEILMSTVDNIDAIVDMLKQVIDTYYAQDIEKVQQLTLSDPTAKPAFLERILFDRNRNWSSLMPGIMNDKATMFVVGAAHLPGENGLIATLKSMGYDIEPVEQ